MKYIKRGVGEIHPHDFSGKTGTFTFTQLVGECSIKVCKKGLIVLSQQYYSHLFPAKWAQCGILSVLSRE